jgi:hypothetical protein
MRTAKADDYVSVVLSQKNQELSNYLKGDVIAIRAPIRFGVDDIIRHEVENLHEQSRKSGKLPKLIVMLETTGGQIEIVERIHNVFRKHYSSVDFIVPNYAYSAGTVLALSGDEIYMDYYSVLGPIDPQYAADDGRYVPGLGYLQKFKELSAAINDPKAKPEYYRAELAFLLKKFDPAVLFRLEQAKSHSISLLKAWLPKYKFKNWKVSEATKRRITTSDKRKRAEEIAEILSNAERWHSHGRGIGLRELTSDEIKLKIVDFGADNTLNKHVREYYELLLDYCYKLGLSDLQRVAIHTKLGLRRV